MRRLYAIAACSLLACGPGFGCASREPKTPAVAAVQPGNNPATATPTTTSAATPPPAVPAMPGQPPAATTASPQAIAQVVTELRQSGALDPESEKKLVADLQQTDPSLWPLLVQSFRSSLAYRQQVRAKRPTEAIPASLSAPAVAARAEPPKPLAQAATSNSNPLRPATENQPSNSPVSQPPAMPVAAPPPQAPAPLAQGPSYPTTAIAASVPAADQWQERLAVAIAGLEAATREPPKTPDEVQQHVHLRMLYLAAGRREDALRPVPGIPPAQQDFWSRQLYGLTTYLDTQRTPDQGRRAAEAAVHLGHAQARLAEMGSLVVRNLAFCTRVDSYGVYTRSERYEFKPGQKVLLYSEVENFKSEETPKGHHTALRTSYQIVDGQGRRVFADDFPLAEEYCQNPRRDYFLPYALDMPERMYDGNYTLQLTIEDTLGQKIGQASIDFAVKGK